MDNTPAGLMVMSASETLAYQASLEPLPDSSAPEETTLAADLDNMFQSFSDFRHSQGIETQMLDNLRAINSEYTADQKTKIAATGGSDIYMGITGVKHRAAISWLLDIFTNEEDKVWGLKPSPLEELPPDAMMEIVMKVQMEVQTLMQQSGGEQVDPSVVAEIQAKITEDVTQAVTDEAIKRAKRMERVIHDQMVEGGFQEAFNEFVQDVSALKAAIIKGPVLRMRRTKKWVPNPQDPNSFVMAVIPKLVPTFERVSPFDAYPSPTSCDFTGDFIEVCRFTRQSLADMVDLPGYDTLAIQSVLDEFDLLSRTPIATTLESERADLEDKESTSEGTTVTRTYVEGLEAWFAATPEMLDKYGMIPEDGGASKIYHLNVIKVGPHVIYKGFNSDYLGRKPYYHTGWCPKPGSFWYRSVVELMAECQKGANGAMRSLMNNLAIASGPQAVVNDITRLPAGEDVTSMYPWKVWLCTNRMNSTLPAVQFTDVDSNAAELLNIFDRFVSLSDDWTNIPAYAYGNDQVAGAGRTASGLSMLMSSAAKGIKRVILSIDKNIFRPLVERMYDWNMENNPDPSIKGDLEVETTGAVAIMVKEQMSARRMEMLQVTNNPTDIELMGQSGRAELLRESLKSVEIPGRRLVLDDAEIERKVMAQQQAQQEMMQAEMQLKQGELQAKIQKDQADVQLKQAEIQLKQAELEAIKMPESQSRMAQGQSKMATDQARTENETIKTMGDVLKGVAESGEKTKP